MLKVNFRLIVYRYEVIVLIIVLLLTGGIAITSKDAESNFPPTHQYPYKIALTFDDGPHEKYTKKIVDTLREYRARATFFVVGKQVLKFPELARYIVFSGNEIANHTLTHKNLSKLSSRNIRKELVRAKFIIEKATNIDSNIFRPPGGRYNSRVIRAARKLNINMILWSVFPGDHSENDPGAILEKVLTQASDKGVVLLHSGKDATLEALPKIIKELRSRGYRFVTVSELRKYNDKQKLAWLK